MLAVRAGLCLMLALLAAGWATAALGDSAQTGAIGGTVSSSPGNIGSFSMPIEGVVVTASSGGVTAGTTTTDVNGNFELDNLPAPASYTLTLTPSARYEAQTLTSVIVSPGQTAFESVYLQPSPATISGVVTDPAGREMYGTTIMAVPIGVACPADDICGPETFSGPTGSYTLSLSSPGAYEIEVMDSGATIKEAQVQVTPGDSSTLNVRLPPPSVPSGTIADDATRALGLLNRERASVGLPAGIVLNPRWSQECAAHDRYEADNDVLSHPENPKLKGASAGGAWAGLHSILAEGVKWTTGESPWWDAPIHLIQLFTPSLSGIGIDDRDGWDCATTWPGLLRPAPTDDIVYTYPGNADRGVPTSEDAQESPFVPSQFVGIPEGTTTGRELFVYLNEADEVGQASVKILHATLTYGHHNVTIRWVDNTTATVGPYLSGGIIIPVRPLHGRTRYTGTVILKTLTGEITHTWNFTTARS